MRHALLSLASLLLPLSSLATARGQTPQLVKDINDRPLSSLTNSTPDRFVTMGGYVYFAATTAASGHELFRATATPGSVELVKDIQPGSQSSFLAAAPGFVVVGEVLYFAASDGVSGHELWRSDGTAAGTWLVRDILPGPGGGLTRDMKAWNGIVYFPYYTTGQGEELWRSDGTAAGTWLVKDCWAGAEGGYPNAFVEFAGELYFIANASLTTRALWRTDGTTAGTVRLLLLTSNVLYSPVVFASHLWFVAQSPTLGTELWRSDGTTGGTAVFADIFPGAGHSTPTDLMAAGSNLFFFADDGPHGKEPWKTDGTLAGTTLVLDIDPGTTSSNPVGPAALGNLLVFSANQPAVGREPWRSDGTAAGTYVIEDIWPGTGSSAPGTATTACGLVFFSASDGISGRELWRTDGNALGASLVKDINATSLESRPDHLTAALGYLFFNANDQLVGVEPWRTTGSEAGTVLLGDVNPPEPATQDATPAQLTDADGTLYFVADAGSPHYPTGSELWKSDGTTAGTVLVKDINPGLASSGASLLTPAGPRVFFKATQAGHGPELWSTDGTTAGTTQVEMFAGAGGSDPTGLCALRDKVYFRGTDAAGPGLFVSDGTLANTQRFYTTSYTLDWHVAYGNSLYMTLGTLSLARSDGTTAGTVVLGSLGLGARHYAMNGQQFVVTSSRLVRTDGTVAGTAVVRQWNTVSSSAMRNGRIYLSADDGVVGAELWSSDGTTPGTALLADIRPGGSGSNPSQLVAIGDRIVFAASSDAGIGNELWQSDGTTAGTTLVVDIHPGASSSAPTNLTAVGDRQVYFTALDAAAGRELWRSDGTSAGTYRLADLNPGVTGSNPTGLTISGDKLFFAASDGSKGRELWMVAPDAFSYRIGAPYYSSGAVPELSSTDPILGQTTTLSQSGIQTGTFGILVFSLPGPRIALGNGCNIHVDPGTILNTGLLFPDGQGRATMSLSLPADPGLVGFPLVAQTMLLPVATPPFGVDLSNAVRLRVGL